MKKDFVSLAEARPDLAKEWNYEKNGDLKPEDVSYKSNKKVWWIYHYDVPDDYPVERLRGKHFKFEWRAFVNNRNRGKHSNGCPFLNGEMVWKGYNDLETVNPELAVQWHPTKNGELKPTQVTANSNKKVWWLYSYDDQKTGKHFDFEKFSRRILATSVVQLGGFLYVKISPAISYFSFSKNALLRKNPAY